MHSIHTRGVTVVTIITLVFAPVFRPWSIAAWARSAHSFDGPKPVSGFDIRTAAIPHVAIAHDGSWASTSRKVFSASP